MAYITFRSNSSLGLDHRESATDSSLSDNCASAGTSNNVLCEPFQGLAHTQSQLTCDYLVRTCLGRKAPYGGYSLDLALTKYNRSWASWHEFERFLQDEMTSKSIELRKVETTSGSGRYLQRVRYVCSRHSTGGEKEYNKKHPEWSRKIPTKVTDCPCKLTVKSYHETPIILGIYRDAHNHDTGSTNLRFTRISKETRDWIAGLVRMKVQSTRILEMAHNMALDGHLGQDHRTPVKMHRNDFIVLADVRRIEKAIEAEGIRLNPDDGASVYIWAQNLRRHNSLLGFKSVTCPIPVGSGLAKDTFSIMIQTPAQRTVFREYGNNIVFIDGTHNISMYQNMTLTTIIVRDKWGHGYPAAWMIASSGTQETISFFLRLVREASPHIKPLRIMSDRDVAQINSCQTNYPESWILLCWWHVLHAWQQHFVISQNEELWVKLKLLIRITDGATFQTALKDIQSLAPPAFWTYFAEYWLPERFLRMWSAVYRKGRGLLEMSDTNMLVEAWHHILKGKFLEGRRNRRLDHLLHVLVNKVVPYFEHKQQRQQLGFEGDNLEVQKRKEVLRQSKSIRLDNITQNADNDTIFFVASASRPSHRYEIDIVAYTCNCLDYPVINFCKHICAVQQLFPGSDLASSASLDAFMTASTGIAPATVDTTLTAQLPSAEEADSQLDTDANAAALFRRLTEKLERFVTHLRLNESSLEDAQELERWLDNVFPSNTASLLPKRQSLSPRLNSWPETQAVMMPAKKTKAKRGGDPAYGAGETSGKKAKKAKKASNDAPIPSRTSLELVPATNHPIPTSSPQPPTVHQPPIWPSYWYPQQIGLVPAPQYPYNPPPLGYYYPTAFTT